MKTFTNLAHWASKCASLGTINKKRYYLFFITMLLTLSTSTAWAEELYFEGFEENHRTSGSNSYTAAAKTYGDWTLTYADAVTSGSPLTGTAHVIMRVAKSTTNSPSLVSNELLSDNVAVTKVSWNCKGNTAQTLKVSYSTNGNTWTEKYSANLTTSKTNKSFTLDNIPGPIYLKFVVSVASSTGSNRDANIDDITIEGTALSTEETYSVTLNQPSEGGTIEADKDEAAKGATVTLTATPDEGYKFGAWDVKDASSNSVSVDANGQFTMPESNVTVTASFVEKTKHTITWSVNGATKTLTPANVYEGDALGTLPTLDPSDICTGKVFVGWTTEANKDYKHATDAPEFITKDTKPSANTTYYAVFATESEGGGNVFDGSAGGTFKIYAIVNGTNYYAKGTGSKISSTTNEGDATEYIFTKISDGVFSIKTGTTYLTYVSSTNLGTSNSSYSWNISEGTKGSWRIASAANSSRGIVYRAASYNQFGGYATNNITEDGTEYYDVEIGGGSSASYSDYTTSCGATPTIYNVTIAGDIQNGTVTASPTSAAEGATITLTVTPADGYMLNTLAVADESSNLISVTDNKFEMPASNVTVSATFKEIPAATLTLSKNGETEDITGYKQDDKVTLPSITSDCVKEFVGWSANASCATEPEYKAGDEYTLVETAQTLYAVYATVGAGETLTITPSAVSGSADPYTFTIDATGYSLTAKKNSGSTAPTYSTSNDVRVYAKGTVTLIAPKAMGTIVFNLSAQGKKRLAPITASVGTIATQASGDATVTWTGDATEVTFTVGDNAEFGSENTKAGQLCFGTLTVTTAGSYSNYSTTCAAALANPTFSLAEGKYTEAKSVTISAAEGTIHYTLDGAEPTTSSTQYTDPIALNDCGEYTIKAIAISSDSQSDVVSATYTIKLPLTNSEAAPYTETEAIAAYDGGCYDNQDVYVKGTVKTATFYTSGTYTITLTNGFQFYKFYKSATKELFTDGAINAGDVLVACGKLSKFNTTYQLAEGCYLVSQEKYEGEKTDISNTEETAYTVDQAFALIADVSSDLTKEVYVKGLVAVAPTSNPTADGQMTYSISDNGEKTGKVLKVYLGLGLNGEKFTSKSDVQLGDYVVVKGQLLDYNGTYELNKGNQLVQYKKAATITIADITMEVGETKTIAASVVPAEAEVTYTIKENVANAISLSSNTITANSVGSATITATIATTADYMGKTVDFTVTVNAKSTKEKVVILAEYEGQWYAMKAQYVTGKTSHLAPLPVTYFDGKLYNVSEEDKALIEWERAVVDGKATFYNDGKYLTGKSDKTDLTLAATACEWTISEDSYLIGSRTFLYNAENNWFRNFGTSNAGDKNYSDMPTVTAPVYATGDIVYTRPVTAGNYGTICLPYGSNNYTGAEFYEVSWLKAETGLYLDQLAAGTQLVAGKPYIFRATSTEIKVTCTGAAVAEPVAGENGLTGTFDDIATGDAVLDGNYIIAQNQIWVAGANNSLPANRAYINATLVPTTEQPKLAGRRRVCMGENAETGVDNIITTDAPVKVIENGQLIIIRDGVKYNVQGQKL